MPYNLCVLTNHYPVHSDSLIQRTETAMKSSYVYCSFADATLLTRGMGVLHGIMGVPPISEFCRSFPAAFLPRL